MWEGNALKCRDRDGIQVTCDKGSWKKHIVPKHKEVEGQEAVVEAAINSPGWVYQDKDFANRKLCYAKGVLPSPHSEQYLRVVIEYRTSRLTGKESGHVVSAFACTGIREGDKLLWSQF